MGEHVASGTTKEFVREGVTMALYLSLSLLAVLLAVSPSAVPEDSVATVFLTAVGLLVAHLLAFSVSSRLVSRGVFEPEARRIAVGQILGGAIVVVVATVPMVLFDAPTSLRIAEGLLILLVAGVGYLAARQADVSVARSFLYVAIVLAAACGVLILKALAGH